MNAKDSASLAVSEGMSVRRAAKEYGVRFSILQNHLPVQDRPVSVDPKHQEAFFLQKLN